MKNLKNILGTFYALIATGGPGGTRFIIFTLFVYLFDTSFFEHFLKDVFLILSLNVVFCQSYTIFYYKTEYRERLYALLSLSAFSLFLSLAVLSVIQLGSQGFSNAWILLVSLHWYFFLRVYLLANSFFKECAALEVLSFLSFLFFVICVYLFDLGPSYLMLSYACALLISSCIVVAIRGFVVNERIIFWDRKLFVKACNFSISNFSGGAVLFLIPQLIDTLNITEFISLVSLSLTFSLIIFLIPRTYATKILPRITVSGFLKIRNLNYRYNIIVALSSLLMFSGLVIYNYIVLGIFDVNVISVAVLISFLMAASQFNFIYSHTIVIYGNEAKIRDVHIKSMILLSILLGGVFFSSSMFSPLTLIVMLFLSIAFTFLIRGTFFSKIFTELERCEASSN